MKKLIVSALMMSLFLPCMPTFAIEEMSGYCGENLEWKINGTTLTISGEGEMWDYEGSEGCYPFWYEKEITDVVLEEGITYIGDYAFYEVQIKNIKIPESVQSIGEAAFARTALREFYMPDTVRDIDNRCFLGSRYLYAVRLSHSIEVIDYAAFEECDSLTYIEFPENITAIGQDAFKSTGLVSVTVPGSVEKVYRDAFSQCSDLSFIEFEEGVKVVDYQHFYNDYMTMLVPASMESIHVFTWDSSDIADVKYAKSKEDWDNINQIKNPWGNAPVKYTYNADLSNRPSDWAEEYAEAAKEYGMTTENRYSENIMRYEFCSFIHSLIENKNPQLIKEADNPTGMAELDDMYDLIEIGIIQGDGDGNYRPYWSITRQESAVIIKRVIDLLKSEFGEIREYELTDKNLISDWAEEAVEYLFAYGLLKGEDNGNGIEFCPLDNYTREQAIATLMRIIEEEK